jgi:hypothetical protein
MAYMRAMPRKIYDLDEGLIRRIEDYRFQNRVKSEVEAVRRLIEAGLDVEAKKAEDGRDQN